MRKPFYLAIGLLLVALAPSALAAVPKPMGPTWTQTFEGAELRMSMAGQRVMVATTDPASEPAAKALATQLRVWQLPLVMDSTALGDLAQTSDKDIVGRAANLPVDRVAIVRVFGATDVVVTLYDKAGTPKASFAGKRGSPIVLDVTAPPPSDPDEVLPTEPPPPAGDTRRSVPAGRIADLPMPKSDGRRTFEKHAIYWATGIRVSVNAWRATATTFGIARKGRYGPRLRGSDFYTVVGRPDLADAYRLRSGLKYGLGFGGGAAFVVAGTAMVTVTLLNDSGRALEQPVFIGGLVLVGIGALGIAIAYAVPTHPVTTHQRKRLADDYNESLLESLQMAPADLSWTISPTVGPDGGGLAMSGQF